MTGIFIAFEGVDGSGKSTQVELFSAWAAAREIVPLLVREPGGTALGERVRELVLDPATGDIAASAEALLYAASRAELVAGVIAPHLAAGGLVVADRFVHSSLAYQGAGRGLGVDNVLAANELAIQGTMPDIVVLVRVPHDVAIARRAAATGSDRIEAAGAAFFERVADAYDEQAERWPDQFVVIDGEASPDVVHAAVIAALEPRIADRFAAGHPA